MTQPRIFITGTAGFISFHLARLLLDEGWVVAGFDGMTPYYDVRLKARRHQMLLQTPGFEATVAMLEDADALADAIRNFAPDAIAHLAAQVGVRHSLGKPRAYLEANLVGTFNALEAAREAGALRPKPCESGSAPSPGRPPAPPYGNALHLGRGATARPPRTRRSRARSSPATG